MDCKLDQLAKRCRYYHLKKRGIPLFFILILFVSLFYFLYSNNFFLLQPQHNEKKIEKRSVKKMVHQKSESPKECLSIQLLLVRKQKRDVLYRFKDRVEQLGFHCHIRREDVLKDPGKEFSLLCNTAKSKEELIPSIKLAKKYSLDYQIRRDECRFVREKSLQQKKSKADVSSNMASEISSSSFASQSSSQILRTQKLDIKRLQKLFEQRKSYDIALKIAHRYYDKKAYRKALKWAKRANRLDRTKEDAWILYAKSLYKLGFDEKAKNLLKIFLNYEDSQKAKQLLKEWQ